MAYSEPRLSDNDVMGVIHHPVSGECYTTKIHIVAQKARTIA